MGLTKTYKLNLRDRKYLRLKLTILTLKNLTHFQT